MKRTFLISVLLVVVALTRCVFATSDEAACGTYSYSGKGLSLQFTWKLDGVHDLQLNGKKFQKVLPIDSLGRYGSTGLYQIDVPSENGRAVTIQLFVLFDETEGVRQAAAFYIESDTSKSGSGKDWILKRSEQMRLRFTPLPPDKRG